MESHKGAFPLAMTVSSGSSGVSAPFSVLPESLAKQTEAFGQAIVQFMTVPVPDQKEVTESVARGLENFAQSLGSIYQDANASAQSINIMMTEAVRMNFEQGLKFFQDLANVRAPSDAFSLQFGYLIAQAQLFANQSLTIQQELAKPFLPQRFKLRG